MAPDPNTNKRGRGMVSGEAIKPLSHITRLVLTPALQLSKAELPELTSLNVN